MRIITKLYSILLVSIIFLACDKDIVDKKIVREEDSWYYYEYYPNGALKIKAKLNEDKVPNGKTEIFYKSGKIKCIKYFKLGVQDSVEEEFFESGKLKSGTIIRNGKKWGESIEYFENLQYDYLDLLDKDTVVKTERLIHKYTFYNHLGSKVFERVYDKSGKVLKSTGSNFGFYYQPDSLIKLKDPFVIHFYVPVPPWTEHNVKVIIQDSNGEVVDISKPKVNKDYNAVFYNYSFSDPGFYKLKLSIESYDSLSDIEQIDSVELDLPVAVDPFAIKI